MPSVAVIVIGDEILSGKFADENGPFLIRRLREIGADLVRLVTITDGFDEIAEEVARCSALADRVITTGGVGPTHDDRTLEGVARAFGVSLERHPQLVQILESHGIPLNDAALRMATVPEGTELIETEGMRYPVLKVRNVYVFPGVPKLMQVKFEGIVDAFAGVPVHTARLFTDRSETAIAAALSACQDAHPTVSIGSYPRFGEGPWRVIVTLESRDEAALASAESVLRAAIPTLDLGTPL